MHRFCNSFTKLVAVLFVSKIHFYHSPPQLNNRRFALFSFQNFIWLIHSRAFFSKHTTVRREYKISLEIHRWHGNRTLFHLQKETSFETSRSNKGRRLGHIIVPFGWVNDIFPAQLYVPCCHRIPVYSAARRSLVPMSYFEANLPTE